MNPTIYLPSGLAKLLIPLVGRRPAGLLGALPFRNDYSAARRLGSLRSVPSHSAE
jgi:hypothetical protein